MPHAVPCAGPVVCWAWKSPEAARVTDARLLIVDDDPAIVAGIVASFRNTAYQVITTTHAEEAAALYQAHDPHVVILDVSMRPLDGFAVLAQLRRLDPDACVIMLTGHDEVTVAVRAMREGAEDYLTKPYDRETLRLTVDKALAHAQLLRQHRLTAAQSELDAPSVEAVLTPPVARLLQILARKRSPLLVLGEAGTAKQLAASMLHRLADGPWEPLLRLNAAQKSPAEAVARLFGESGGDGLDSDRGLVHLARRGTMFIHLVESLPLSAQARLARHFGSSPEGGRNADMPSRARLVVSSRLSLEEATQQLDRDLMHLFAPMPLVVPPLRARGRDGLAAVARVVLRQQFARTGAGPERLSEEAADLLAALPWRGNLPELEDCLTMAALHSGESDVLTANALRQVWSEPAQRVSAPSGPGETGVVLRTLAEVERQHVAAVMRACDGNVSEASRILGITRTTLYKRLRELGA
ncbi:MAG: hypothetical protein C0516_09820 [Gemmatimonas sp.]|nr:hypothetical protein [Gemmatimonas sp.]